MSWGSYIGLQERAEADYFQIHCGNPATRIGIAVPLAIFCETRTSRFPAYVFLLPRSDRSVQIAPTNDISLPGFTNFRSYLLEN